MCTRKSSGAIKTPRKLGRVWQNCTKWEHMSRGAVRLSWCYMAGCKNVTFSVLPVFIRYTKFYRISRRIRNMSYLALKCYFSVFYTLPSFAEGLCLPSISLCPFKNMTEHLGALNQPTLFYQMLCYKWSSFSGSETVRLFTFQAQRQIQPTER